MRALLVLLASALFLPSSSGFRPSLSPPSSGFLPSAFPLTPLGGVLSIASSPAVSTKQDNGVAFNATAGEYLVAWNETSVLTLSDIKAARLDAATGAILATFTVAGGATHEFAPTVSWNSADNRYLVAWADGGTAMDFVADTFTIRAAVLDAAGAVTVPAFTVSTGMAALDDSDGPRAAYDGTNWLVAWFTFVNDAGGTTLDNDVYARTISPAGALGTLLSIEVGGGTGFNPAVAYGPGGNYLVTWVDTAANFADGAILGRTVTAASGTLGSVQEYSDSAASGYIREEPSVAASATEFLVGWDEDDTNFGQNDVVARRVDSAGAPLGLVIPIEVDTVENSYHATVAWNAGMNQWVLLWYHDTGSFTFDISAVRLDSTGAVLDGVPITVAAPGMSSVNNFNSQSSLASRTGTGQLLAVWRVHGSAPLPLEGRRIDLNTAPDDPLPANLAQDQGTSFVAGDPAGTTYAALPRTMTFRGILSDADGHQVRLEVEHVLETGSYAGTATATGGLAPSTATATVAGIPNGAWKWRARAVDELGGVSNWTAFDAPAGFDFEFNAGTTTPPAPSIGPTATTGQFRMDGTTALAIGEVTAEGTVVFRADVGPDGDGDQVRLEIEVQQTGISFVGAPVAVGAFGAPGNHSVTVSGFFPGRSYHWQAWVRDSSGAASGTACAPVAFGGNPETLGDFTATIATSRSKKNQCGFGAGVPGPWIVVLLGLLAACRRKRGGRLP